MTLSAEGRKAAHFTRREKQVGVCAARVSCVYRQARAKSVSNNLLPLEVREEILWTQVNNKRSNGARLVERIVNEKTTCREGEQGETQRQ